MDLGSKAISKALISCGYRAAGLRICFRICQKTGFLMTRLNYDIHELCTLLPMAVLPGVVAGSVAVKPPEIYSPVVRTDPGTTRPGRHRCKIQVIYLV